MPYTFTERVTLTALQCDNCGVSYAVPESFDQRRQRDGGKWYCPNGHVWSYTEPEIDKIKRQLESAQARITHANDQRIAAERSAAAVRGQMTKLRKRVGNGVCPCCHRTFQQLARHMKAKHPDYADQGD